MMRRLPPIAVTLLLVALTPARAQEADKPTPLPAPEREKIHAVIEKCIADPMLPNSDRQVLRLTLRRFAKEPVIDFNKDRTLTEILIKPQIKAIESARDKVSLSDAEKELLDQAAEHILGDLKFTDEKPSIPGASKAESKKMEKPTGKNAQAKDTAAPAKEEGMPALEKGKSVKDEKGAKDEKGGEDKPSKRKSDDRVLKGEAAKKVQWRASLPAAVAESTNTGKPLLINFFTDNNANSTKLDEETFEDTDVIRVINLSFIAVKVDSDRHESATKEYEVDSPGTLVVARSNNEVVERLRGFRDAATLKTDLKKALDKIDKLEPLAGSASLQRSLEIALKAVGDGRFGVAYVMLQKIAEREENLVELKRAREEITRLEGMATERLAEVKKLVGEKEYVEAANIINKLLADFDGTPMADEALAFKRQLADDPQAREAVRRSSAQALLDQAREEMRAAKYALALSKLETLMKEYPEQTAARHGKWQYDRLKKDPLVMRGVLDEDAKAQARVWLSMARTWKRNRKPARANEYYSKVIETFPGTTYAAEAKSEMSR